MIGAFRHVMVLQQAVLAADGAGGFTRAWQDVAAAPEIRAAVLSMTRGTAARHDRREAEATYKLRARYRGDITPAMRLLWQGRAMEIVSVGDPDGAMRWVDITVAESGET